MDLPGGRKTLSTGASDGLITRRRARAGGNAREILRFGDRLGGELVALIACIPPRNLTASGLSRWLGINRGTCQRVLLAARAVGDGREVLSKAPGVEGLDEFVQAMASRVGRRPEIDRAEAMVQDYAVLVQRGGGSVAKLVRAATGAFVAGNAAGADEDGGSDAPPRPEEIVAARKLIHDASRVTAGMWSTVNVMVQVFRPSQRVEGAGAGSLDEAHARGYIGVRRRADGLALYSRIMGASNPKAMETLEGEQGEGRQWSALLAEFCSTPLPTVVSQVEGDSNNWIILGDKAVQHPIDVVLGGRSIGSHPDPRGDSYPHLSAMLGVRFPTRTQVYDLYLHRDLAAGGRVQATALARHPGDADPVQSWYDKLAYTPDLRAMGPGVVSENPEAYARMSELTKHVFARSGWHAAEFEAWRMEIPYPTPGMTYAITLHPAARGEGM